MHDLASFSMAKESPFDFALACLDRLLGLFVGAVVQEHDKLALPRERRGLAHGDGLPREEPAQPGLLAAGCIPATRARRGARGERRQAARPAGHGGPRARGGVPCNERAQGTARPSGSAMFSRRTAVMRQASCTAQARSIHELPNSFFKVFCQTLGQPLSFPD
jgi:hypothetical protein